MELQWYQDKLGKLTIEEAKRIIENPDVQKNTPRSRDNIFITEKREENSHSNFLAWLFDVRNKRETTIQYQFLKEFLQGFCNDIPTFTIGEFMKDATDNIEVVREENDIDILVKTSNFTLVIENKLDAKDSKDSKGVDQLLRARKYSDRNKFINPKCFVLCPDAAKREKLYEKELKESRFDVIDLSDIVIILYEILYNNPKVIKDSIQREIVSQYIEYWEKYADFNDAYSEIIDGFFLWGINNKYPELENISKQ